MNLAINLFQTYIKQNRNNKNFKVLDAILMAAEDAEVTVFELARELDLNCIFKQKG